ncbi:hypothetical protein GOP47_0006675 [Adiantum capillus-veneris]|uniref:Pentatricopeptide repeat-containing protein n=1 Tax=Adiantum capillus-veneris TaxID=13818 RepID=A0A9D4V3C1_ADICA|nr:hypothetical protein GOP47_0006675 [Adiantum capillus-veneris]
MMGALAAPSLPGYNPLSQAAHVQQRSTHHQSPDHSSLQGSTFVRTCHKRGGVTFGYIDADVEDGAGYQGNENGDFLDSNHPRIVASGEDCGVSHFKHPNQGLARQPEIWFSDSAHNVSLLQTLCKQGHLDRAANCLDTIHTYLPSSVYLSLLRACNGKTSVAHVKQIHAHISCYSHDNLADLGGHLVATLIKCGALEDACFVSSRLPKRTVFSWTAIISAYVECGKSEDALRVYQSMQRDGVEANSHTFSSLFKACGSIPDLKLGRKLHTEARERGLSTHIFVGSTLVSMYSKCGSIIEAEDVFMVMVQRDTVVWNAMLAAYVEHEQDDKAIRLYRQMQEEHVIVDNYTLTFVLQACGNLASHESSCRNEEANKVSILEIGWAIFSNANMKSFAANDYVQTAFLTLLGKYGAVKEAEHIFWTMSSQNIVLWTAMLSVHTEQGHAEAALQLFKQLQADGFNPDRQAFVVALKACALLAKGTKFNGQVSKSIALEIGQALHADACENGYVSNILVGTALITMYGKCGALEEVEIVFSTLPAYDDVSWTALLSVFVENGEGPKAVQVYEEMGKHVIFDEVALVCILQASIDEGNLEMCKHLHFDMVSSGYDQLGFLAATLIHAYASCASIMDAQAVFDSLPDPDLVSGNASISGHTGEAAVRMYERMKLASVEPTEATFTSVLSACTHAGLVAEGLEYFDCLSRNYDVELNLTHYGCLVDLLGRAGDLERAAIVLQRMPMEADMSIWLSLLSACHMHGNMDVALEAFDFALNLHYSHGTPYIMLVQRVQMLRK